MFGRMMRWFFGSKKELFVDNSLRDACREKLKVMELRLQSGTLYKPQEEVKATKSVAPYKQVAARVESRDDYNPAGDLLNPLNPLSPISPISVWNTDSTPSDTTSSSSYDSGSSSCDSGSGDFSSGGCSGGDF